MPKLKNITEADVIAAVQAVEEVHFKIADLADMIQKGYADKMENPLTHARAFSALARVSADLTTQLLVKAAMEADRRSLEAEIRSRIAATGKDPREE